jgi:hypothetical protein
MILDLGILDFVITYLRSKISILQFIGLRSKISNLLGESEARYMLITCSAFINYLTAKHETKQ